MIELVGEMSRIIHDIDIVIFLLAMIICSFSVDRNYTSTLYPMCICVYIWQCIAKKSRVSDVA